jgi:uncharacterized membrane protein YhaH (DUF805 family)
MPQPRFVVPVLGSKMYCNNYLEEKNKKKKDKFGHLVCLALFLPALAVYVMVSVDGGQTWTWHLISFV